MADFAPTERTRVRRLAPLPAPDMARDLPAPAYVAGYARP